MWTIASSIVVGFVMMTAFLATPNPVYAAAPTPQPTPSGPDRYASMSVDITVYEWWLTAWFDNNVYCTLFVDYDGLPTDTDIYSTCGKELYTEWKAYSQPCAEKDIRSCPGYYFIQVSRRPSKKDVTIKLPPPDVTISLEGCQPDETGWCTQQPNLVLTASEPLPNEKITSIKGFAGTDPFSCKGNSCTFKLSNTDTTGIRLKFWSYSTYGDSSDVFEALLRVINDGLSGNRLTPRWYVDVISSQWTGAPVASCAAVWETFPPTEGLPKWLITPASSDELKSNIPYNYLAANLITQGAADASTCPNGGLLDDGSANACGLQVAGPAVQEWQNRFDKLIFEVAQESDVPAQLLKNLFSRESQFWPGVFRNGKDVGLGQMTDGGADTTLLWNPSFYDQFCPLVLDQRLCKSKGFANLKPAQQALLRGALVGSVDARCENCPLGLDLSRADFSVGVFAKSLLANCEQAGKIVKNLTNVMPGQIVDYETMWRFTLANYNAGSGCLIDALTKAYDPDADAPLSWDRVAGTLDATCPGATGYVNDVSKDVDPVQISTVEPSPSPAPSP